MRRNRTAPFLAFALLLVMLAAPARGYTVGELSGVVRNAENREPVTGATVRLGDSLALTRPSGDYRVPLPMSGRFVVRVEASGYHGAEKTLLVDGGAYDLNFDLTPRRAEARVYGTVYDALLLVPVARAEVALDGDAMRVDGSGQFVFDPVEAGDRWLTVAAAGYRVSAKRLRVDSPAERVDVYLVPDADYARVRGTVRDRVTSRPVALAVVRLGDARAVTSGDGRFELPAMIPGEKPLAVSADDFFRYDDRLALKSGDTALDIHLEPRDADALLAAMRRKARDAQRIDPAERPARVDCVNDGFPGPAERRVLAGMKTMPLQERAGRLGELFSPDGALPEETFVRIRVRLAPEGHDAGFLSFLFHGVAKTVRNVSLRAEGNPHGVLLSKATTRFTRESEGLTAHLSVGDWSGSAPVAASGRVAEFEVTLFRAADLIGPTHDLLPKVPPPLPPAGYEKRKIR